MLEKLPGKTMTIIPHTREHVKKKSGELSGRNYSVVAALSAAIESTARSVPSGDIGELVRRQERCGIGPTPATVFHAVYQPEPGAQPRYGPLVVRATHQ